MKSDDASTTCSFEVGQKLRIYFNPHNINNKLYHVRAIVDNDYLVVRMYRHGHWIYKLERLDTLQALYHSGFLKFVQ